MDRTQFFSLIRRSLFGGAMSQPQVSGTEALLAAIDAADLDVAPSSYVLATAYHETARSMQPVDEYGPKSYFDKYDIGRLATRLGNTPAKDGDGYLYRGRGYVQLTGRRNYALAGRKIGIDLVAHPDLAGTPDNAAKIAIAGMIEGWFTGRKLDDYFISGKADFIGARAIINGSDRAALIAGYAQSFRKALAS
jgi:hypothetical protein